MGIKQKGGNWTSASSYGTYVNGTGPQQFDRMFSLASPYSNSITTYVGAQGENYRAPDTTTNLNLIQSAGKGKKGRKGRKGTKGGFNPIIAQGIVPAVILGMQQSYNVKGNKKPYGKKTRKQRFKRSRRNRSIRRR